MTNEAKEMMREYYTTPDRLPHGYGTIHYVSRMIKQGYLRPAIGNLHLATA